MRLAGAPVTRTRTSEPRGAWTLVASVQEADVDHGLAVACRSGHSQMIYNLGRLRLNGLIRRIEHTHTYVLAPEGQRIAMFCTKPYSRLLRPLAAAGQRQAPPGLRRALTVIDHHADDSIARARFRPAA